MKFSIRMVCLLMISRFFSFVLKGSSYGIYRQSTEVTAPLLLTL